MEQLTNLLAQLAEKLGTTVEHLYQVMMAQTAVEGQLAELWMGIWLWGGIIFLVIAIIMLLVSASNDFEAAGAWAIFFILADIVVATLGYYEMYSKWLTLTQNPEYWVIQEILSKL